MAFTVDTTTTECAVCHEPRYDVQGKDRKTFDYIPITHRLRLQWANRYRAKDMSTYVASLGHLGLEPDANGNPGHLRDIWDGRLILDLKSKGLFKEPTDIALGFSTDGANLFKMRGKWSVWPMLLLNYNLSPAIRSKQENLILISLIPGPSQKEIDLDTFMRPLIEELKVLEVGIDGVWNAFMRNIFKMKAHLCTISGDTPARDKIAGASGSNSYSYCIYCKAWGVHNGAVRCPFTLPNNIPLTAAAKAPAKNWCTLDPASLTLRNNSFTRQLALHCFESND